ncbi:RNA polymerase factor sigma-54 [Rhodoblastus acidophilus]|uniref:RNA polymerase sigma-54 factor n=1 Tax=Candidatus Rhodoblastus alkanivorans TaxID=2954117 RepID=A0ABS9Z5Q0_9HYPH|nr:RNA polymerase factor sigma-54 [Candidatus Rhodoblastus alkanivorans]MCI4679729.1 RNA polymerase factor sigma-54 [Candidatus Rhodoblastus alkanivorans]MCI4681967.1 RNA polymerase factor sigma-54 [Candidatus Rhodoblastus alkanivorans]MDI4643017.1 RNA polymerase factor sigma-54 [Rhodoblastus acidophilus]
MALSAKMLLRQGQSLVMTPQLLQAIKLLQYSSVELAAFVEEELERNPLLERAEEGPDPTPTGIDAPVAPAAGEMTAEFAADPGEGDWATPEFATTSEGLTESLGSEIENAFDGDRDLSPAAEQNKLEAMGLSDSAWSGVGGGEAAGEASNIEAYVAGQSTLAEFLSEQLALATDDSVERMIGLAVIDAIDEAGYLRESAGEIAERLGAPLERVEKVIFLVQTFEPTGVGARDLAECLALQLREQDRFDPAMEAMVANLPLVARRDFPALRKICGVDDDDLKDMMAEIRRLDPKPGRAFGGAPIQPVAPDVIVRAARDGSWLIELNSEALPRVLVNQAYVATVSRKGGAEEDKSYMSQCLQTANWLTKSLEQRARTILKVSTEIVRRQDAFLAHGVEHLRPLNLKNIADAVGLHESTVSRVTSNKYMATPRGLFELKYFFTASIAAHGGGDAHSAEAVRFKIKQMIDAETADAILSDDAIVERLKAQDIDIARRTVAKYRESLRIPSSVERRREKQAPSAF